MNQPTHVEQAEMRLIRRLEQMFPDAGLRAQAIGELLEFLTLRLNHENAVEAARKLYSMVQLLEQQRKQLSEQ